MPSVSRVFASTVLALLLAVPIASATPVFLLDTDEASFAVVHRVDPATGQLTFLGNVPMDSIVAGLAAVGPTELYTVSWAGNLIRITVSPFAVTTVGNVGPNRIVGLAYGNGALYATDEGDGGLWRIDPMNASRTLVGTIRFADDFPLPITGGDLAQEADGTWLLWTNGTQAMYELNVANGVVTPVVDQVIGNGFRSGLAIDYDQGGQVYTSSGEYDLLLYTDRPTGANAGSVGLCLNCPTPYDAVFGDLASPRCADADGDGFSTGGGGCGPVDCNDANPAVNPLATERCNAVDDDCDGVVNEEPVASASCSDNNACTIGDRCDAGTCRAGTPRNCGLLNLIGGQCRPSDGRCCGRLINGILPLVTVCLQ